MPSNLAFCAANSSSVNRPCAFRVPSRSSWAITSSSGVGAAGASIYCTCCRGGAACTIALFYAATFLLACRRLKIPPPQVANAFVRLYPRRSARRPADPKGRISGCRGQRNTIVPVLLAKQYENRLAAIKWWLPTSLPKLHLHLPCTFLVLFASI